jgi:hypothetical protein
MGNNALRDIDAGIGNPSDRGLVMAGRILGIIATVLMILGILDLCNDYLFCDPWRCQRNEMESVAFGAWYAIFR